MIDEYRQAMECEDHWFRPFLATDEKGNIIISGKCDQCGGVVTDFIEENKK